ncbi:MAG: type I-D CRISPR-associated protein Cas10d/Csc3, partial [Dolichospermum sp.]
FYPCFDPYTKFDSTKEKLIVSEKSTLNHPQRLTKLYRRFYRAKSSKGKPIKSNSILKPIDEAADTILKADKECFQLVDAVAAKIFKLMERVRNSTAEGRWVIAHRDEEREAILDFARYFVVEVFEKSFASDRARLAGRQLNLIRDTCEFLYRLADDEERKARPQDEPDQITEIETEEN